MVTCNVVILACAALCWCCGRGDTRSPRTWRITLAFFFGDGLSASSSVLSECTSEVFWQCEHFCFCLGNSRRTYVPILLMMFILLKLCINVVMSIFILRDDFRQPLDLQNALTLQYEPGYLFLFFCRDGACVPSLIWIFSYPASLKVRLCDQPGLVLQYPGNWRRRRRLPWCRVWELSAARCD